jgi:hypothetical protein
MITRKLIRQTLTPFTIIISAILATLVSVNVEGLAKQQGWDKIFSSWWPRLLPSISEIDPLWAYPVISFLAGSTFTIWAIRFFPEKQAQAAAPKDSNAKQKFTTHHQPKDASRALPSLTYEDIDGIQLFTVEQACCYWCDATPTGSFLIKKDKNPRIGAIEQTIISEYKSGRLNLDSSNNALSSIGHYENSYVSRAALIDLANRLNKKPKFLFPEER